MLKEAARHSLMHTTNPPNKALRMQVLGPHLGMPFTRPTGSGLLEVRANGQEGIGRACLCPAVGHTIVILHAFSKKTQKTPRRDLELARRRLREVRRETT
jgi:phage-related protein